MPFSDTAKRLQKIAGVAEDLYQRVNELREQIQGLRDDVDRTSARVESIERGLAQQRVILEALAEKEDIDVDTLIAEAAITDAEGDDAGDSAPSASSSTEGAEPDAESASSDDAA